MHRPSTRSRIAARRAGRGRRVLAVLVLCGVGAAATAGCAGRKGRNDDDPRPNEYSIRWHEVPVPAEEPTPAWTPADTPLPGSRPAALRVPRADRRAVTAQP